MQSTTDNSSGNNAQERILKNTSYLTVAFILQKILSFLYFVYIARELGPVDLGLYDPIKSLIPTLLILIDFSLSVVLVREIARKPDNAERYLGAVLGIKALFAFIIITLMGLFTNLSDYSPLVKTILYLDAIIVVLDTFTLTFFAVFRGLQNMKFEAIGIVGTQILTIIFGVISLRLDWGLQALFVAVVVGSVFNFIFSYSMIRKKLGMKIRLRWDGEIVKKFLKIALPFAIAAMFVKIYTFTDRYMLLFFQGQSHVGWYVTAHKLTFALEFIPSAFAASIFPAMSSYYLYSHKDLAKTFQKTMHYLMLLAVPISVGMVMLADKIILTVYGPDFATSILPLRILISSLIVVFLNFPVGAFLNACNKQIINTRNMGITVAVNVALNIWLIPQYSFNGAAVAAFVSGFVLFFLGLRWVGKTVSYDKSFLVTMLVRTAAASVLMGAVLFFGRELASIYVLIPVGVLVYFGAILLFKGVTVSELKSLFNSTIRKLV